MSVPEQDPINQIIIVGGETTAPWTWNLQKEDEIVVTKLVALTGVIELLILGVDYTVNPVGLGDDNGGTINFEAAQLPAVAGDIWTMSRDTTLNRSDNFAKSGDFFAQTINNQLDKLTRIAQDSGRDAVTAVRKNPGVGDTLDPLIPQMEDRRTIIFKDTGGGNFEFVMSDNDPDEQVNDAAASAAAALASEQAAAVSETNAATSEGNAATSEGNAATSETNAATSETNAATSETNAANSASGVALRFNFDDEITMVDPGASDLRFNNATLASVTQIAIDALSADAGFPDVSDFIASWDDSNNPGNKGVLFIRKSGEPATFVSFKINAAITDNTGWLQIPVTFVDSNGTFTDGDEMFVQFSPAGDSGLSVTTKGDLQTFSTVPVRLPVGSNGQALLADSAETTGLRWGSGPSGLNKIINGNMTIVQRGTSFADPNNIFTLDRWFYLRVGSAGVVTITQDTDTPSDDIPFSLKLDVTTADASIASGDFYLIRYNIEGFDIADAAFGKSGAKQITLSFFVKAPKTGINNVAFRNGASDRSYIAEYTINSADTWEKKEITITADTTGTWLTDNGKGLQITFNIAEGTGGETAPGVWTAGNFDTSPNSVRTWMDNVANNIYFTNVKLEIGSSATPFENRPVAEELYLSQRYFERFGQGAVSERIGGGVMFTSGIALIVWNFKVRKRIAPTCSASVPASITITTTGVFNATSVAFTAPGVDTVRLDPIVSGATAGNGCVGSLFQTATFIEADAEF